MWICLQDLKTKPFYKTRPLVWVSFQIVITLSLLDIPITPQQPRVSWLCASHTLGPVQSTLALFCCVGRRLAESRAHISAGITTSLLLGSNNRGLLCFSSEQKTVGAVITRICIQMTPSPAALVMFAENGVTIHSVAGLLDTSTKSKWT